MTTESIALTISIISLIISALTFWLTKLRKGSLRMTRPTMVSFVGQNGSDEPKIYFRTLLYATADQGQYIQNMFVRLRRAETTQNFNRWAYVDEKVVRGSGLFASRAGVCFDHHFLLPKNEQWIFGSGEYRLEVYVETVDNSTTKLFEQELYLTSEQSNDIGQGKIVCFDWAPNARKYITHTMRGKDE